MAGAKRGLGRGLGALFGEDTIEEVIAEEKAADRKMANGADRIVEKNSARTQKKNEKKSTEKSDSEVGKVKNTDLNQKAQESEKQITAVSLRKIEKVSEKTEETVKSASSFAVKPEQEELAQTELELKVSEIEPNQDQPRKAFDQEQLEELADSIRKYGVLQPLLVQKKGESYEIIAGERRWRAAKLAGLKTIPVVIREYSPQQAMEIALIENAQAETVVEKKEEAIPVVLAANEKYVPILYTCLKSIMMNTSTQNQYEFYIFHTDITPDSQKQIQADLESDNRKIIFINVCSKVAGYRLQAKEHITTETFYRFLILDILKDYEKVVYLDCDMIIQRDVAELYHTEMGTNLIAAVRDPDFVGQYNGADPETRKYCDTVLKLQDPYRYFQAGVLVLNVKELRNVTDVKTLFEMSDTGIYKYSDQDILNVICEGHVTYLDMSWNTLTDCNGYRWHSVIQRGPYNLLDAYEEARRHPYIIHYAGFQKPWMQPEEDMAKHFWEVARTTPYYEEILGQMCRYLSGTAEEKKKTIEKVKVVAKKVLPKGSWMRRTAGKLYWKLRN